MQIVELKVAMDCEKCEKKVRKALLKMMGVESVTTDLQQQRVTVMGYLLDAKKLVKQVKSKTRLHTEVWCHQYSSTHQVYGPMDTSLTSLFSSTSDHATNNYYSQSHKATHGPITHKSNDRRPAYDYHYGNEPNYRPPVDDTITTMFTDENPNNCSIM